MKDSTIEDLAYIIKEAEKENQPMPIFFLGAGASKTGQIPLASDIVEDILSKYADAPKIKKLDDSDKKSYSKLMGCLQPHQRDKLLKGYIDDAKINVTHIYLAQLLKNGYADYVLTVNFDNLMLRALALFNEFPATYDMAILKDITTTRFKKKSVVYLHGQHHGLWLLNTTAEMAKVEKTVPSVFDSIKDQRPWVFIGYSGDDPIFDHIKKNARFDNGLYWVTYKDNEPNEKVKTFLKEPNRNAYIIKGYDSDSFMLKLNQELELPQPEIIDKPFSSVKKMLDNIVDIDDDEHYKGVKKRLEVSKKQVDKAIEQFEEGKVDTRAKIIKTSEIDLLKKELIDLLLKETFSKEETERIAKIEIKAKQLKNKEINNLLATVYFNQGTYLGNLAETKEDEIAEDLYHQSFEKFQKAIEIKPDYHDAFYNWGVYLGYFAKTKKGVEVDVLYEQAFEKYQKAIEIKSDYHEAFFSWGTYLGNLAQTKKGKEKEDLYNQAIEKYQKAIDIKPNLHGALNNWGAILGDLAESKKENELKDLYHQAFDKYQKAIEIKPDYHEAFYNWGNALGKLAKTKEGKEAEVLCLEAFEKLQKATDIKPDLHEAFFNWGIYLGYLAITKEGKEADELYHQAFEKYQKSIEIKSDKHEAFNNWGNDLGNLANIKEGEEAEVLYHQAFEKFQKAIEIEPDKQEAFCNWGIYLGHFAITKEGKEAEQLYNLAFEKFQKAIEIKPDYHDAFYNWGTYLGNLAKTKEGHEAKELYNLAIEKFQKAIALGSRSYNLACLYAIKLEKEDAFIYLENCLADAEITAAFVRTDDDWIAYRNDKDWLKLLNKYEKLK